jgi:hypothetical protein
MRDNSSAIYLCGSLLGFCRGSDDRVFPYCLDSFWLGTWL